MRGLYSSGWRKHKRDSSHKEVADALAELGASVRDISMVGDGLGDLLVGFCNVNFIIEVKSESGSLEESQEEFARDWRGRKPILIRNAKQARDWYLRTRRDLTGHRPEV